MAVTGLSGSGKTAFITSLVTNLISAAGRPARLPFLRAAGDRRLIAVRVTRSATGAISRFPLEDTIAALADDPPRWPASTTGLRRLDLSMCFFPSGVLAPRNVLGRVAGGSAELKLEILDYPGEWLLDLPLLGQSYADWSQATLELAQRGVRAPLARDWLGFIERHPSGSRSDARTAQQAHSLYRAFLAACRSREHLSLLQPGRFLNPGDLADASVLGFCPLPLPAGTRARAGSPAAVMETRFDAYKRNVVQPFFLQLARGVDRQIVLVDVLRALNAGEEAFTDHRQALETILQTFRYSRRGLLQWLFGARIDRVLFAATKADHVPALQRDHLAALIANMVAAPTLRAERSPFAGRRDRPCLDPLHRRRHGRDRRPQSGRRNRIAAGQAATDPVLPGIVPVTPPPTGFWGERFTEFPVFQPPRLDDAGDRRHSPYQSGQGARFFARGHTRIKTGETGSAARSRH